ncbi:MAG: DNA cytosine methyltransferase [Egibacteraceae bacterium]
MSGDARTAVDLFCGAGGISLGLEQAGYRVLAAVDVDRACAQTHRRNLPEQRVLLRDIRDLSASALATAADPGTRELDLLIGGPVCQGYSIIGRRLVHDERNDLFRMLFIGLACIGPNVLFILLVDSTPKSSVAKPVCMTVAAQPKVFTDWRASNPQ